MPRKRTRPHRGRVEYASEVVEDAIKKEDFVKPETVIPKDVLELSYEKRLERQIRMASMALNKYENKLLRGVTLTEDEERLMISQQDSLRKLETTLQAMNSKQNIDNATDLDLALRMIDRGKTFEEVVPLFKHNPGLAGKLKEALNDRA